jgi:hypothetical protein
MAPRRRAAIKRSGSVNVNLNVNLNDFHRLRPRTDGLGKNLA